jgi:hypothetical protein
MARSLTTRPAVDQHQPYLDGVAKNLADKLYGPAGPPRGTTFAELEELAVHLAQSLSREILTTILARQAMTQSVAADDCPTCGQAARPEDPVPRTVTTRVGEAAWDEPQRHCPRCRRSFFPSEPQPGDGPVGRVTGGAGADDLSGDALRVVCGGERDVGGGGGH